LIHAPALIQNYEIKQNSSPIGGKRAYFYRKKMNIMRADAMKIPNLVPG
jgi:hypothetical protein